MASVFSSAKTREPAARPLARIIESSILFSFILFSGRSVSPFVWSFAVFFFWPPEVWRAKLLVSFGGGGYRVNESHFLGALDLDHMRAVHHDLHDAEVQRTDLPSDYFEP